LIEKSLGLCDSFLGEWKGLSGREFVGVVANKKRYSALAIVVDTGLPSLPQSGREDRLSG